MTLFFIWLRLKLPGMLDFIAQHWRAIVITVLFAAYSYGIYVFGYNRCEVLWVHTTNSNTKIANERIAELETSSRKAADESDAAKVVLAKKLEDALSKVPHIVARDSSGKALTCNGKTVESYLGEDFSKAWNVLNEEGNSL